MHTAIAILMSVSLLAAAGCLGTTPPGGDTAGSPTSSRAPGGPIVATGAAAASAVPVNFTLYLTADRALAAEPPSDEGSVTQTDVANSPEASGYPQWDGTMPVGFNASHVSKTVVFFVTTNSATIAANTLPPFADAPRIGVRLGMGNVTQDTTTGGPPMMQAGEVEEITATLLPADAGWAAAGDPVSLLLAALYTHVQGGAEFRILVGPQHPSRIVFTSE